MTRRILIRGSQWCEEQKRDEALALLANTRRTLVAEARRVAIVLANQQGTVTSPQVLSAMRKGGWGLDLDSVDARFMGVVFRKGWIRVGWENRGSHARPVSIWRKNAES